ncbi:MAG: TrkH family potassium uptake protein [Caldilineaceae bacterium]
MFISKREDLFKRNLSSPQLIAVSFLVAILLGGILLSLPFSHSTESTVSPLDALFTATSALCVTGLAVVDTGKDYSFMGQIIVMLLVQIGGFGIITLGTIVALVSGRRIGFRERLNLQAQINTLHVGGVVNLLRRLLWLVVLIESVGALLLFIPFALKEGVIRGLYFSIFHSISAFNNAGFGLYSDNLMQFVADPLVNFTIMALIVLGGLGFLAEIDVILRLRERQKVRRSLFLHTKIVLLTTLVLIVGGALIILLFEWDNVHTLGTHPLPIKVLASLFQSVTPRTAGFNTLDYGKMYDGTLAFTMLLMFIGGSPGSTAGGIKTVTFFVLIGSAWSVSRGQGELVAFGRKIDYATVARAGSIAFLSVMLVGGMVTLLSFTNPDIPFYRLTFEAISAFGTVGLSTGITPSLSASSKVILILLMYLGRIGPLTLALALMKSTQGKQIEYPTEDVLIG